MANSLSLHTLALNEEFRNRVRINLVFVTHQIVGELNTTPYSAARQAYGSSILNSVDAFVHRFSQSLVTQAGIAQTITLADPVTDPLVYSGAQTATAEFDEIDVEIQSYMSAVYNDLAGITSIV